MSKKKENETIKCIGCGELIYKNSLNYHNCKTSRRDVESKLMQLQKENKDLKKVCKMRISWLSIAGKENMKKIEEIKSLKEKLKFLKEFFMIVGEQKDDYKIKYRNIQRQMKYEKEMFSMKALRGK